MVQLLSVNVGLPRDIAWKGRTVRTGIWKNPVHGRCRVGRLNLDGRRSRRLRRGTEVSSEPSSSIRWIRIATGRSN